MADRSQFEVDRVPAGEMDCAAAERWLAEWAEDSEPAAVRQPLQQHAAGCAGCREKFARAGRGLAWLRILRQQPMAPPVDLAARILAQTSGADHLQMRAALQHSPAANTTTDGFRQGDRNISDRPRPLPSPHGLVVLRRSHAWRQVLHAPRALMESRVAMVAAMAFFSISLTLNLAGVRLTGLRPADFTPRSLRHALTRGAAETDARLVRYYENLRIVYEVEARVQQLRRAADAAEPSARPEIRPKKQAGAPRSDAGTADPRMDAELNTNAPQSWPAVLPCRPQNIYARFLMAWERGLA